MSILLRRCLVSLLLLSGARGIAQTAPAPAAPIPHVYDVRDFGATGDGKTLDTDAINQAIAAAATNGGGTVHFPAGTYLSFTIRLKSNITLYLDQGCTIMAANPAEAKGSYDAAEPNEWDQYQDFGHSHWQNSLITGSGLENISIVGPGLINGKALVRFGPGARTGPRAGDVPATANPTSGATSSSASGGTRPGGRPNMVGQGDKAIGLKLCHNVLLRDFSVLQGGHFALLATGVDNLTIDNLKIDTNRDGFDIDACRNVRLSNCTVNSPNDDGICLKNSGALGAARPCENITITNCQVSGYDLGSLLDGTFKRTMEKAPDRDGPTGRIKLGTESYGPFRNITVSNCVFDRSRGFAIESVDGSIIEDVTVTNIVMREVSSSPLFFRLGSRLRGPDNPPIGAIRRITLSNITASDVDPRYPIIVAGIPGHPIEDVHLENIHIIYRGGLTTANVTQQTGALVNTFFQRMLTRAPDQPPAPAPAIAADNPREAFAIPEWEAGYPEPSIFGLLPAYGLFIRHARNVTVNNMEISFAKEDERAPMVLMDVSGIEFDRVKAAHTTQAPIFALRKVSDFTARQIPGLSDAQRANVDQEDLSQ
jgi:parallel beta-helix repeat protein